MASYEKNLRNVKEHLEPGEEIIYSCFGDAENTYMHSVFFQRYVFVVTQKRVVFFSQRVFGFEFDSIPLANITGVEISRRVMETVITLAIQGNATAFSVWAGDVKKFGEYIRDNMGHRVVFQQPTQIVEEDIPGKLKQLAELHQSGVLTQEEYDSKKTELLNRM